MELTLDPSVTIDFPGGALRLRPDGSVHGGQALFVADLQLGKTDTAATLVRLTDALLETEAVSLVHLGELWNADDGLNEDLLSALIKWRARHTDLKIWSVRGSEDHGASQMLELLEVQEVDFGSRFGAISLHAAPPEDTAGWLAGGVHPTYNFKAGRRSERLSCFWATNGGLVLPAYGGANRAFVVEPQAGERIYVMNREKVLQVPLSAKRKR